jgi:hypothetical protein
LFGIFRLFFTGGFSFDFFSLCPSGLLSSMGLLVGSAAFLVWDLVAGFFEDGCDM